MKTVSFKKLVFIFVLFFSAIRCESDKNHEIIPGISIYKTRGDYFDLVDIGMKDNTIFRRSSYSNEKSKFLFSGTDTIYTLRSKLANGFILDGAADFKNDAFLKLTFKQHILMEVKYNLPTLPDDTLLKYLLDKSPYLEFLRETRYPPKFEMKDSIEINKIIKNGELEQYFTRIK